MRNIIITAILFSLIMIVDVCRTNQTNQELQKLEKQLKQKIIELEKNIKKYGAIKYEGPDISAGLFIRVYSYDDGDGFLNSKTSEPEFVNIIFTLKSNNGNIIKKYEKTSLTYLKDEKEKKVLDILITKDTRYLEVELQEEDGNSKSDVDIFYPIPPVAINLEELNIEGRFDSEHIHLRNSDGYHGMIQIVLLKK